VVEGGASTCDPPVGVPARARRRRRPRLGLSEARVVTITLDRGRVDAREIERARREARE
jgi:hypothetical protein